MRRDGRPITGRGDYILGTELREFYYVYIKEPRVSMDHRMILAELKGNGVRRNCKYCKGRTTWVIVEPNGGPIREEDAIFYDLQK